MPSRAIRMMLALGLVVGFSACATPVAVVGDAPALTAVQAGMAITVGEEKDLLPFIRVVNTGAVPFVPLTWEVSNPALLSIDPVTGRARGLAAGSVVVQVRAGANQAGATQLVIDVIGEGSGVVKDVRVVPGSHHMAVGESVNLVAQVFMPDGQINGNVVWSSSDNTIATVNQTNGAVTALRAGRVTVLAAYALAPAYKGIADIIIYPTRADIPASPMPVLPSFAPRIEATPRPATAGGGGGGASVVSPSPIQTGVGTASSAVSTPSPAVNTVPSASSSDVLPAVTGGGSAVPTLVPSVIPQPSAAPTATPVAMMQPSSTPSASASFLVASPEVTSQPSPSQMVINKVATVSTLAGTGVAGDIDGPGYRARFHFPRGMSVDARGDVFVSESGNHKIRKITPEGEVSTLAGSGASGFADGAGSQAQFDKPSGIAIDGVGNLYVADGGNHRIRKVTPGGVVTTLAGSMQGYADGVGAEAKFSEPRGVAVDGAGNVYVADSSNNRIRKIDPKGMVTTLAGSTYGDADGVGSAAQFYIPTGVGVDATGTVYVTDADRIRKIRPDGRVTTLAGSRQGFADGAGTQAWFAAPQSLVIDSAGTIYVADYWNFRIRRISSGSMVTTLAGSSFGYADGARHQAQFAGPWGVAMDSAGNLYVADGDRDTPNHRIRKIVLSP